MSLKQAKSALQKARNTKSTRLWTIAGLAVLVFVLWWFEIIKTGFAIGIGIVLAASFGLQLYDYDLDLATLWETGSIQESRTVYTDEGIQLIGSCVTASKHSDSDLNCDNFQTQSQAQEKYEQCASEIVSYNDDVDKGSVISLDIYGLDRDKDGVVCEHLPKNS